MNLTSYVHDTAVPLKRTAHVTPRHAKQESATDWPAYFVHNRAHRMTIQWERGITVDPRLRAPLARSLQRFQVGESGGGSHLRRVAAKQGAAVGVRGYATAIRLFVREEQEHAALMARVLEALDAPLLERHWSNTVFRLICGLSDLYVELMVLLVTETIARQYFSLLYANVGDPVLRTVCAQIGLDEDSHIEFHCDALRPRLASMPTIARHIVRVAWQFFFNVVCLLVIFDHRALLRAAGVPAYIFWQDCTWLFDTVITDVLEPAYTERHAVPGKRMARG